MRIGTRILKPYCVRPRTCNTPVTYSRCKLHSDPPCVADTFLLGTAQQGKYEYGTFSFIVSLYVSELLNVTMKYGCRRTSKKPYRRNCPTYRAPVYYGFIPDLPGIKKLLAGRTNSRANSSFLEVRRHPYGTRTSNIPLGLWTSVRV